MYNNYQYEQYQPQSAQGPYYMQNNQDCYQNYPKQMAKQNYGYNKQVEYNSTYYDGPEPVKYDQQKPYYQESYNNTYNDSYYQPAKQQYNKIPYNNTYQAPYQEYVPLNNQQCYQNEYQQQPIQQSPYDNQFPLEDNFNSDKDFFEKDSLQDNQPIEEDQKSNYDFLNEPTLPFNKSESEQPISEHFYNSQEGNQKVSSSSQIYDNFYNQEPVKQKGGYYDQYNQYPQKPQYNNNNYQQQQYYEPVKQEPYNDQYQYNNLDDKKYQQYKFQQEQQPLQVIQKKEEPYEEQKPSQIVLIQQKQDEVEKEEAFKIKLQKKVNEKVPKQKKQKCQVSPKSKIQTKLEEPESVELSEEQLLLKHQNQSQQEILMDKQIATISQWYLTAKEAQKSYQPVQDMKFNVIYDKYLGEQFNEILKNKEILKICKRKKESNKNSQCQNMKKLIMNGILKYFQPHVLDQLTAIPQHLRNEILRVITRLKESGKVEEKKKTVKMDVFSQPHFNILFLSLNRFSCCNMQKNQQNIDLHKDIFGVEINKFKSIDQDKLIYINLIKEFIYAIAKKFLEQDNPDDNEVVKGYKQRVVVSIKKMIAGNYIKKFQIYKNDKAE